MHKSVQTTVKKLLCILLIFVFALQPLSVSAAPAIEAETGTNYPFVFVTGYCGYGRYDRFYRTFPYWGMQSGDLIRYLNTKGFECYASSVDPVDSAWDRACELYAQMTGTVVDYGAAHAARFGHARYGTDYRDNRLLEGWGNSDSKGGIRKVNFVCHSFGGATVRLMTELLANGDADELAAVPAGEVSGLFSGGKAEWVHSVTTLASPHNGSSLTTLLAGPLFTLAKRADIRGITGEGPSFLGIFDYLKRISQVFTDGIGEDTGAYDLSPDGAAVLNARLSPLRDVYYFSVPTDCTKAGLLPNQRLPDPKLTDTVLLTTSLFMCKFKQVTPGGTVIDSGWFSNDGIVNTISTTAPENEPQKTFDPAAVTSGVWNIMPVFHGDHLAITGGLTRPVEVKPFYMAQLTLINSL